MVPQWIIEKKRDGQPLSAEELAFFVNAFTSGAIPDYQMSALAMAIYFRGMNPEEMTALTRIMLESGATVDTSSIPLPKIDKHSTGGIGDKVSLVLAPLVACCGVAVPMISGRGLGITGGTLDKLEAIPGYRTNLDRQEFLRVLSECGCSIIGQTEELAPADRKLYALRDVTGTVPSIPLIVASILSKKLAEGIDGLVLDVKCGSGAFMKTRDRAEELAYALARVSRNMGKKTSALITAMDQPLGRNAGNALEVAEAIASLRGEGPEDLVEVTLALASRMLRLAGVCRDETETLAMLRTKISSGEALERFKRMVTLHGGRAGVVDDPGLLPVSRLAEPCTAPRAGFIREVNAEAVGRACLVLGAGRTRTSDPVDPGAGVSAMRKVGERVNAGDPLVVLHANRPDAMTQARELITGAFALSDSPVPKPALILGSAWEGLP